METHPGQIESLVEKAEQYGKSKLELVQLKTIDISSDIISSLASKLAVTAFFSFVFLILNIGIALWIGEMLGKSYFGFFSVAAFYLIAGIVLYRFRDKWIKAPVKNSIIIQTLN